MTTVTTTSGVGSDWIGATVWAVGPTSCVLKGTEWCSSSASRVTIGVSLVPA